MAVSVRFLFDIEGVYFVELKLILGCFVFCRVDLVGRLLLFSVNSIA